MSVTYYSSSAADGTILTAKYPDLQVGDEATDDVTQAQFDDAVLFAYTLINSMLKRRYGGNVPFSTSATPGTIHEISDMLTVAQLKATASGHSVYIKGPWSKQFDMAIEWLEKIAERKRDVPGVADQRMIESSTEGEHPIFAKLDTFDLGQDSDQLDRLTDERD